MNYISAVNVPVFFQVDSEFGVQGPPLNERLLLRLADLKRRSGRWTMAKIGPRSCSSWCCYLPRRRAHRRCRSLARAKMFCRITSSPLENPFWEAVPGRLETLFCSRTRLESVLAVTQGLFLISDGISDARGDVREWLPTRKSIRHSFCRTFIRPGNAWLRWESFKKLSESIWEPR